MTEKGKMMEAVYTAQLTQRATLVIFYLINRADKEMTCFPGVKTIARECNISERTVQRALNDLEEAGFVRRESRFHDEGGQRSNLYVLGVVVGAINQSIVVNQVYEKNDEEFIMGKKIGVLKVDYWRRTSAFCIIGEQQKVSRSSVGDAVSPSECQGGGP